MPFAAVIAIPFLFSSRRIYESRGGRREKKEKIGVGGKKPVVFGKQAAHTCFAPYQTYVRVRVRCLDPHLCYLSTAR